MLSRSFKDTAIQPVRLKGIKLGSGTKVRKLFNGRCWPTAGISLPLGNE